eukprot:2489252-Karenia_brevis.AAC.1
MPKGLINLIEALYQDMVAYVSLKGKHIYFTVITSGVAQGCPLSGLLFAVASDVCIRLIQDAVHRKDQGIVRGCADDLAVLLKDVFGLLELCNAFQIIRDATCLTLKIPKCKFIPVSCAFDEVIQDKILRWIELNLPSWQGVK